MIYLCIDCNRWKCYNPIVSHRLLSDKNKHNRSH